MLSAALLSLAACLCGHAFPGALTAQEAEPSPYKNAEAGFELQLPVATWTQVTQPGDYGISTLAMGPKELGGTVQFSIQISAASANDLEALTAQRDDLLLQVEAVEGISAAKKLEFKIAGLNAPGLEVEQQASGDTFLVRQAYLISQGLQYKIQFHAPKDRFDEFEPLFQKTLDSFAIVPLSQQAQKGADLRSLAARCGSEIDWLSDWQQASELAKKSKKLIVVTVSALGGFDVGDQIGRGPFMDQDVVHLLQQRFIVLRWRKGMGAPFESQDAFGMGPSTFGTGLLLVTPDGQVVRQIYMLAGTAVYDVLIDVLQGHPQLAIPKPAKGSTRQQEIEFLLQIGELRAAEAHLASSDSSENPLNEAWLHAELQRLQRNGPEAMAALDEAIELAGDMSVDAIRTAPQLFLLQAELQTAMGQSDLAESMLDSMFTSEVVLEDSERAKALLLKGALRLQAKDRAGCEVAWNELMNNHPDSRWAWLAAAAVSGPAWGFEIYPSLAWPQEQHRKLAFLPQAAEVESQKLSVEEMIVSATDYLLSVQQENGSWTSLTSYGKVDELADDFQIAATVIAGRALLHLEDNVGAQQAAQEALDWLLKQREILQAQDAPPVVFMDYAVWNRSYCIFFLADCLAAELGDENAVRQEMENCIEDLLQRQQGNGGWSYYLSGTAGGDAIPQAISFTTATVVLALERAIEVGSAVDEPSLARGLACLEKLRSPEGTFAYFLHGANVDTGTLSGTSPAGSAARGPVCALALHQGKPAPVEEAEMPARFEMYLEHLHGFGAQRRKALMHAGADTQGSHYLLYDYSTAAEALRKTVGKVVTKPLARKVFDAVLKQLQLCRNKDGSFIDNPLMGVDISTGLGLQALIDLQEVESKF